MELARQGRLFGGGISGRAGDLSRSSDGGFSDLVLVAVVDDARRRRLSKTAGQAKLVVREGDAINGMRWRGSRTGRSSWKRAPRRIACRCDAWRRYVFF